MLRFRGRPRKGLTASALNITANAARKVEQGIQRLLKGFAPGGQLFLQNNCNMADDSGSSRSKLSTTLSTYL